MNKTDTKSTKLLKHDRQALKFPTLHGECEKIAQRCPSPPRGGSTAISSSASSIEGGHGIAYCE